MVLGEIWGALIFRSLGFAGNPDWGKEGLAFGNLFLLMIILALILFVFKHLRRRPAIFLNLGGPQSFFGPGMAYSSFPAPEGPPVPSLQAPSIPALQHIRNSDPSFSEPEFLSFAKGNFS